jgi:SAM-dependent methyltransferase
MKKSFGEILTTFHAKDVHLTDRYLLRTPFHPGYWVRTRIDDAIKSYANNAQGVLFDVGCGIKPFESIFAPFVESYIGLEYSPESGYRGNAADFCGDAAKLPLADECVDTILCTEVMEHVHDPERAISEFARVLRPGGIIITTAPFVYPIHDKYDFFRYSPDGLAAIMKRHGLEIEKVEPLSGTAVTLAVMFNLYWYEIGFVWTKWLYPIGLIIRPILWLSCFLVNVLGRMFEILLPSNHLSFNHLTVARKR